MELFVSLNFETDRERGPAGIEVSVIEILERSFRTIIAMKVRLSRSRGNGYKIKIVLKVLR